MHSVCFFYKSPRGRVLFVAPVGTIELQLQQYSLVGAYHRKEGISTIYHTSRTARKDTAADRDQTTGELFQTLATLVALPLIDLLTPIILYSHAIIRVGMLHYIHTRGTIYTSIRVFWF